MAVWLSAFSVLFFLLYVVSLVIPVWHAACPFATPMSKHLRGIWTTLHIWTLQHTLSLSALAADVALRCGRLWRPPSWSIQIRYRRQWLEDHAGKSLFDQLIDSEIQRSVAKEASELRIVDYLDCEALSWLTLWVSDSDAHAVVFQAFGGLEHGSILDPELAGRGVYARMAEHEGALAISGKPGLVEATRILRSILRIDPETTEGEYIRDCFSHARPYHELMRFHQTYPDMRLLSYALRLSTSSEKTWRDYYLCDAIEQEGPEWKFSPSIQSTVLLLASLKSVRRRHVLLFLLCCDVSRLSLEHWSILFRTLRGNSDPCSHHAPSVPCNSTCFLELLAELLQVQVAGDLDPVVLTKLFDAASAHLTAQLSDLPTFVAYISSDIFLSHTHSTQALSNLTDHLGQPGSWDQTDRLDPIWLKAWQHVAYSLRLRHESVHVPARLIASAFWDPMDRHDYEDDLPYRQRFTIPTKREDIVPVILRTAGIADQPVHSIWRLIATGEYYYPFVVAARKLAAALCTMARNGGNTDDFVNAFLAPLSFVELATHLYVWGDRDRARSVSLAICSHIMELRPLWWVEGMNHLLNEDGQRLILCGYSRETVTVSALQDLAVEITDVCLRFGPCYACPLVVTPLAFDISLRTYTVNPFAVYPIVDLNNDA